MSITNAISSAIDKARLNFRATDRKKSAEYLMKYKLKEYFSDDVPEDERETRQNRLEEIVDKHFDSYDGELGGIARKTATKTSMGLAVANDAAAYVTSIPIANVTALGYALFAGKTIAELPAMKRYVEKSKDWYGATEHYLMKPLRFLVPVVGPFLESGAFERMVARRARYEAGQEASAEFIKEFGEYEPIRERVSSKLKTPVEEAIYFPGVKKLRKAS